MAPISKKSMRSAASALFLWQAVLLGAASSLAAAGPAVLTGHVPRQIRGATKLERAPADENVDLSLVVRIDQTLMDQTLAGLYGPNAPRNKRFLSSAEFIQKFDLVRKRQALKDYAAGAGLTVEAEDKPGSLSVKVTGPSSRVENAFGVRLYHYRSSDGQIFRANDTDPTVPGSLLPEINAVLGLSNFRGAKKPRFIRGRPSSARAKAARSSTPGGASPSSLAGTGPSTGLAPADIKSIYGLTGSLTGSGQTVALLELDGFAPADIGLYETQFSLAGPTVTCTSADSSCNECGVNQNQTCDATTLASDGGMIEVALDIEMMIALAHGVSKILVYTGQSTNAGLLTAYTDIADADTAKVVSTSWGEDEEDSYDGDTSLMTSESEVFAQMATQGQTIYAAAGDAGAYDASAVQGDSTQEEDTLLTDDPASQPYVTGVGGTSLSGTLGGTIAETVWNEGCSSNSGASCGENGAGGGGVAKFIGGSTTFWPLPSYQSGVAGEYSTANRNVPDVALNADPDAAPYSICVGGSCNACSAPLPSGSDGLCDDTCTTTCNTVIGGTSAAAPLWAALTALVDQQRATNGYATLGFANAVLYPLGTASQTSYFNDVTSGNNGYYNAAAGYDNASGWGSFKANALISQLSLPSPPVVTSALTASGTSGTAFSYTITASNTPTSYAASNLPAGLSVNTSNGVVSGTPTTAGTKSVTIGATNAGGTGTAALVLTISNAPAPSITSALSASGTAGAAFSYGITASNSPTSYSAAGLPAGLSVNTSNGAISGTPASAGTASVTIGAANAGGTGTATLVLTINPAAPTIPGITSALSASGTVGAAFSYTITASHSPTSYGAANLPAGLSVNSGSGVISGTPTSAATTDVTLSAANAAGTGSANMVLTINPPAPVITSVLSASGIAGSGFGYTITASNSPTSYSAAGLPAGLSVNTSNGVISGTPISAGTASAVISAANGGGTGSATLVFTISPAAPTSPVVTSALSAAGTIGAAFSYAITATNSPTSYNAAGLPAGLSVNTSNGVISGTPTSGGTASAVISATNPGGTGAATLVFTVYLALSSGTVSASGTTLTLPQVYPQVTSINVFVPPGAFPADTPISAGIDAAALPAPVTNEAPSITPFGANVGLILNANGLQPTTPVTITLAYDFTQIPPGQNESRLQLWRYDPTALQWTLVPSQDNASDHVLTAQTPHFSTFSPFFVAAGTDVSDVQVFPQPWEIGDASSQYWSSVLTLSGLPGGATVKIFTIRGELVWDGTAAGSGVLTWDGNNRFGRRVASGTYYASFQNGGQTKVRRLVIIR
jgi:hypothetical protein